jgi:parvulin-like peptidyl-prolyl isomerase
MRNTPPSGTRRVRSAHESRSATVRAAAAAPSKRQQSKWQREQHQLRLLYIAVGALGAVIVLVLVGGIVYDNVVRANEVVAQVGPDSITASQLVDEMRQPARAIDAQARQSGLTGAQLSQSIDDQKRSLPDRVLNDLIDRHVVQQEADRRGISVAPSDLDDRVRETVAQVNLSLNPPPTAVPTSTPEGGAPTVQPTAVPTADQSVSPTPFPSPTPVPTLDASAYGPALAQLLDRNFLTEPELRTKLQDSMLQEKVEKAVAEDQVPANQEQVHARHILVATEDQAKDVLQQLQGGADFAQLAQTTSTDPGTKDKGGDLGWFPRGVMDKPFEDAAFALDPGQLSDVVHGANGYHVIQVLEKGPSRPVPQDQLDSLRAKAGSDWLNSRRSSSDVKLQLSQGTRDWALARLGVRP